jgi:hypothetical protein
MGVEGEQLVRPIGLAQHGEAACVAMACVVADAGIVSVPAVYFRFSS